MKLSNLFQLLLLPCFLASVPAFASKKSYVVYLGAHSHGKELSASDLDQATDSHYELLRTFTGSREEAEDAIFYSYTRHINGFAAVLEEEVAKELAKHPTVISVFPNKGLKLHTTRSWDFLELEHDGIIPSDSIWKKARFGEDTIIANLDTGVWPESKSFSDEGLGPIPSKWKGICQNDKDPTFHCNRKLIGARYFNKGYAAAVGPLNSSIDTPRDVDGHGSHTLSTAGGGFASGASVFGLGRGTAKGGSPMARVATYRVCYPPVKGNECYDADVLAAFDAAIADGVDVISVSLGGGPPAPAFFDDSVAIGSFHAAVKHGIAVVCSAGNSGPTLATAANVAPWEITVGASTMDRAFTSYVVFKNGLRFQGQSLSSSAMPANKFYPIINAANASAAKASVENATLCKPGSIDPRKAKGKIVVCVRGGNGRVDKGQQVALAGGVGMVLVNSNVTGNDDVVADAHVLPATHLTYKDGVAVFDYLKSTKKPKACITPPKTVLGGNPAPSMAAFSSRGPNTVAPEILKPDVTAPGVSVIAAYSEAESPTNEEFDKRRVSFNAVSGTSMSCPHVSGVVGLLKTLYPSWSPAAIRSAIMTTATTLNDMEGPILNASNSRETPFSYGAGHIRPNQAMYPGLVYDADIHDYLNFLCSLGYNKSQLSVFSDENYKCPHPKTSLTNLNYPSIVVPRLSNRITVTRTVKNVGPPGTYTVRVKSPHGVLVLVKPKKLKFDKIGEERSFRVILKKGKGKIPKDYMFGEVVWSDKKHSVRSTIAVKAE